MTVETTSEEKRGADASLGPGLRVATWNLDHWKRTPQVRQQAWEKLRELGCDVVLLQEAVPPETMGRGCIAYRTIGDSRSWGSAVVALKAGMEVRELDVVRTRYDRRLFPMLGTFPGAVIVAQSDVPALGTVTFVSVYGLMNVYAQTSMFRIVADLIPLFDSPEGEHVVLGGDFNVTTATAERTPELPRYKAILSAVESLGLKQLADIVHDRPRRPNNCPCGDPTCKHLVTYRGSSSGSPPNQLDYLYATPALAKRCRKLQVPAEETVDLSDHVPIIAEFDVSTQLERTWWDPDSFATLIGERHGAAMATVVENLFAWATGKQDELRRRGHRDVRLDRLPVSEGTELELWLQVDRGDARPLQWTCSLRSDGQVAIQFQFMRERFATEDARQEIWHRLSAIRGIDIERRLNGRPTFPLSVLADGDRFARFAGVLDYLIEQTLRAESTGPEGGTSC